MTWKISLEINNIFIKISPFIPQTAEKVELKPAEAKVIPTSNAFYLKIQILN